MAARFTVLALAVVLWSCTAPMRVSSAVISSAVISSAGISSAAIATGGNLSGARGAETGQCNYIVSMDQMQLGAASIAWAKFASGESVVTSRSVLRFKRRTVQDIVEFCVEVKERTSYTPAGDVICTECRREEGGMVTETTVEVSGSEGEWRAQVTQHGAAGDFATSLASTIPIGDEFGAFVRLIPEFLRNGTASMTFAAYKFDTGVLAQKKLSLIGRKSFKIGDGDESAREENTFEGIEATLEEDDGQSAYVFDECGIPYSVEIQGRIAMVRTDTRVFEFEGGMLLDSTLPVDVAVKDWRNLRAMEVELDGGEAALLAHLRSDSIYHTATPSRSGVRLMLRSSAVDTETDPARLARLPMVIPVDICRWLAATPLSQSDDQDISKLARSLAGDRGALETATCIVTWVHGHVCRGASERAMASARETLQHGTGDCTEHAALTVALCRAAGLPARNAFGLEYIPSGKAAVFGYHAWAQVWIGRWIAVDSTIPEVGTSARYIHFGYNEPEGEGMGDSNRGSAQGLILETLGRLRARVLSYRIRDGEPVHAVATATPDKGATR